MILVVSFVVVPHRVLVVDPVPLMLRHRRSSDPDGCCSFHHFVGITMDVEWYIVSSNRYSRVSYRERMLEIIQKRKRRRRRMNPKEMMMRMMM